MGSKGRRTPVGVLAGVGAVAVLTGFFVLAPGGAGDQPAAAAELTPFDGCDDLRTWFADAALPMVGPYGFGPHGFGGYGRDVAAAEAGGLVAQGAPAAAAPRADASAGAVLDSGPVGPGATGTNVQEAGVDEPDLLKSDGSRLVVVRGERLHVLDVSRSTPRELGSLLLPARDNGELLLADDRALVVANSWSGSPVPLSNAVGVSPGVATDIAPAGPGGGLIAGAPSAVLTVVDLSDPSSPSIVRTDEIEGGYLSAREHDGVVRVVLQSSPQLPLQTPTATVTEEQATTRNRRVVQEAQAQDWLPKRIERDADGAISRTEPLLECAEVSHPVEPAGLGVISVLTLDLGDPGEPRSVAVAADGDLVYSSTQRMYVATTRGGWVRPQPMPLVESGGVRSAVPEVESVRTQVHAFDVSGKTTSYVGSGEVEGWLMGRWAMSEYDGRLRVATTRDGTGSDTPDAPATDAAVSVLEEDGDRLEIVGTVSGLGKGEQVRAVRWFGNVATVVTFRQTDPLYTLDLSDPTEPQVLGELKVPGYSAYLHPLGDGLLLGVGQDATDQGRVLGTQVSTFDLSNLAEPKRIDTVVEQNTVSEVESDSRQFSYLPGLRLALLPISGQDGSSLWALRVSATGRLDPVGDWQPRRDAWIMRALPIEGGRLAVLTEGSGGGRVTLLGAESLVELGTVRIG